MKFMVVALLGVSAVLSSISLQAQCPATEATALEALDRSWGEMSRKGDRAGLEALYAPEFAALTPSGATGKARAISSIVENAERDRQTPPTGALTHDHYTIACTPSTATITHRNVITPAGGGAPAYTRSVHFLEKRAGRWMVVSTLGTPVTDAMAIEYLEREWSDADVKGDAAWYAATLDKDYRGVSSRSGAMRTRANEIADATAPGRTMYTSAEVSDLDVHVEGSLAVATGTWTGHSIGPDKKSVARTVRYTDTFVKRDGRWIPVASQGTVVVP